MIKEVVILVGNIGSGKSYYTKKYQKKGYVVISRDQLRYAIGNGNYVWNIDYEPTIWSSELYMYRRFIELGINIIVDEVGVTKTLRQRYIKYAKEYSYKVKAIVMPRLSMLKAVRRRIKDPHGQFDAEIWKQLWFKFDVVYEKPTKKEGFDSIKYLKELK